MKLLFLFALHGLLTVRPVSQDRDNYLLAPSDSNRTERAELNDSVESSIYKRNDFNWLIEEFSKEKPISVQELIENRTAAK